MCLLLYSSLEYAWLNGLRVVVLQKFAYLFFFNFLLFESWNTSKRHPIFDASVFGFRIGWWTTLECYPVFLKLTPVSSLAFLVEIWACKCTGNSSSFDNASKVVISVLLNSWEIFSVKKSKVYAMYLLFILETSGFLSLWTLLFVIWDYYMFSFTTLDSQFWEEKNQLLTLK